MELPVVTPQEGETPLANAPATVPILQGAGAYFGDQNGQDNQSPLMPKSKRSLRWLWITLGVIGGVILAVYIGMAIFFMSHFTFNATVNGVNVAFQSADEVEAHIASELSNYTLSVEAREDERATITASQIDLKYVSDGQIDDLLNNQQPWAWPLSLMPDTAENFQHVSIVFDKQKLTTVLSNLPLMNKDVMRAPVDAHLTFEGNAYVIAPGDIGTTLDVGRATQVIQQALDAGETTVNLEKAGVYANPAVPADDPALVADRDRFNTYVPFQITYTFGERREVLDGNTTLGWVNTNGEAPYTLNEDAVRAWVANLASHYDTLGSTRTIINGFGEQKTVSGGTYGWQIDQEAEFWAIINAAEQHLGEQREPYLSGWADSLEAQDWGTTYLEVDLTRQHMWYYVNGEIVIDTDVVTGNPNTGYATPEGVYAIFLKASPTVARGDRLPDGTYEWEVPVTYWMQFTYNGCGFHDADWQPSFGGDAYTWRGSHGCINMPPYLAAQMYPLVEYNTPVVVHY